MRSSSISVNPLALTSLFLTVFEGSNGMSSCVLDFIETKAKDEVKEFHFWSDNCNAQNKNQFLFPMYSMACQKFDVKIIHRWLVKGHTHMECDR